MTASTSLTDRERQLIYKYLEFYKALALGKRRPTTEAQKRFVAVTGGRARAESEHEVAYIKWKRLQRTAPKAPESDPEKWDWRTAAPEGLREYPPEMQEKFKIEYNNSSNWDD
jgi:hypothetical protein